MDQDTRNKLQQATQQVRRILEEEFAEQLEGTFDVLPNGKILTEPGKHLDARQRLTRQKLVDAIEHIKAGGKTSQEAVDEYTREAEFTFLNRFVALRMLEARGMLQECVSKGDASSGFKEFCGLAPGLSSLDDGGYRLYLECLFDELTIEVKVLFDRRDSASLLWPRRGALTELLDILGQADLAGVWSEDETIGWVYQYFNSGEERKKMREESQAPRNSRELAVRNQFFTPRYVVEFLTDNTLGRIWYEMRKGDTRLANECQYLVRRPSEVFLTEGQKTRADDKDADQDLSQEDLLKKTVYIPHRAKKDPRDLKILDPACGSGHFLLYAFDLLISIYEEAWHDEVSPESEVTEQRLQYDYPELEQLYAALPGLVLAHNLHGIDIDPRAAQIAALALWMRGQRAFNEFGITRAQGLPIARSNIVCAEPMPGEAVFLDEFIAEHMSGDAEDRFLASLVRKVFDAMKLAGEAGSLLKIEEDIAEEVEKAKKQWVERPEFKQQTLFDDGTSTVQKELDLTSGITDALFWEEAEHRIYDSLRTYSEQAERSGGFQRCLFSVDAVRGFAFIDVCRKKYDVILMNPPFGDATIGMRSYLEENHPEGKHDLAAAFVAHSQIRRKQDGIIGVISTRTLFFLSSSEKWRFRIFERSRIGSFADLGFGVMDDALVYAAAYTVDDHCDNHSVFFRGLQWQDKASELIAAVVSLRNDRDIAGIYCVDLRQFKLLPGWVTPYWLPLSLTSVFHSHDPLGVAEVGARQGIATSDDFRFVRAAWEAPPQLIGTDWAWHTKGGEFSPYYVDVDFVINWTNAGRELKAWAASLYTSWSRTIKNVDLYHHAGLTFTYRSRKFGVAPMPHGVVFGVTGMGIFIDGSVERVLAAAALLNSTLFNFFLFLLCERQDPLFQAGKINKVPWTLGKTDYKELAKLARTANHEKRIVSACSETSPHFTKPCLEPIAAGQSLVELFNAEKRCIEDLNRIWNDRQIEIDKQVARTFNLDNKALKMIEEEFSQLVNTPNHLALGSHDLRSREEFACDLVSFLVGCCFGRWNITALGNFSTQVTLESIFEQPVNTQSSYSESTECSHVAFVDDTGNQRDLVSSISHVLESYWKDGSDTVLHDLSEMLGVQRLRDYVKTSLFSGHLLKYTKCRRKAPIYWQLGTPSASYSVWVYYHHFTKDTFFQVLNEYVKPKLDHERQKMERLRSEGGDEPTRSQRKETEGQEKFVTELASMAEEVERIAPLWNPNLNDGVIINFAPLWRLVPQNKSWQKECKKCWDKLVNGEYNWAHLAMHLWPERVVPKCVTDASLAIAHGLEEVFWEQDDRDRFQPKEEPQGGWEPVIEKLVDERTSPAVKAALNSLLTAPAPAKKSTRRKKAKAS